jgi:hypothetical protein
VWQDAVMTKLTWIDDTHVLVTPAMTSQDPLENPESTLTGPGTPLWEGPECQMCCGGGVARFIHDHGYVSFSRCPACNGHGREAS